MKLAWAAVALAFLVGLASAAPDCSLEAKGSPGTVKAYVESCSDIGTFSVGGLYGDSWNKLTFNYPEPWKGTFTTFNIDGSLYCNSENPKACERLDGHVDAKPHDEGGAVVTEWRVEDVTLKQTVRAAGNMTTVAYSVRNAGAKPHTVGIRLHLDTMLGYNDGAPIYLPGQGIRTTEVEYIGGSLGFEYWKAYNRPDEPTIVATGLLDPKDGMTYPDRFIVADWKRSKDTAWDYRNTALEITGDSAVIMYWALGELKPGQEKTVVTGYGSSEPVLGTGEAPKDIGIAEITPSSVSGKVCPGDEVEFKVDVISALEDRSGTVTLTASNRGAVEYSSTASSALPRAQAKTLTYRWRVPEAKERTTYDLKAVLSSGGAVLDTKERPGGLTVDPDACAKPGLSMSSKTVGGLFALLLLVLVGILITALLLAADRGTVEFTKYVDGESVRVKVVNGTRKTLRAVLIEDAIPSGAEISVSTINAVRRQSALVWDVGDVAPKDAATLEYRMLSGQAVNESRMRWERGERKIP